MEKVRWAVVGVGAIFVGKHGAELKKMPEARIEIVADTDEDVARKIAREYGCRWTADYHEAVADSRVDAVLVCVPPFVHEEVVIAAARAGKHILCEKPLAPTVAGCDRMIQETKKAGAKLMVAENWVFDPLTTYVKARAADGTMGTLRRVHFAMGWPGPPGARFYDSPRVGRNGVLLEDGIHLIAMSRTLLGSVKSVTARTRTVLPKRTLPQGEVASSVEDEVSAILEFEDATSVLEATWLLNPGGLHSQFHGDRASLVVQNPGWEKIQAFGVGSGVEGATDLAVPEFLVWAPCSRQSYHEEHQAFLRCLTGGAPIPYPGEQAREDVRIMELVYEAAESGRTTPGERASRTAQ